MWTTLPLLALLLVVAAAAAVGADRPRVWIDTDIGDDADDAVALSLAALLQDQVDVAGVSTIGMEAGYRAKAARALLDSLGGNSIAVHEGRSKPFGKSGILLPVFPFATGLLKPGQQVRNFSATPAVDAMYAALPATIAVLGPTSNVAEMLSKYPDAAGKIDRLVIMGAYPGPDKAPLCESSGKNETYPWFMDFNLVADGGASMDMLRAASAAGVPVRFVPLVVTTRTWLTHANLATLEAINDKHVRKPNFDVLLRALRTWGPIMTARCPTDAPVVFLHDPLTFLSSPPPEPTFWAPRYERKNMTFYREDGVLFRTEWGTTQPNGNAVHLTAEFPTSINTTAVRDRVMSILSSLP